MSVAETAPSPVAERRTTSIDVAAWSTVAVAALMMLATLPGRTHGLGLVTEQLLATFPSLSRSDFATMNLWATLFGALFCFPAGWCIDRFGLHKTTAAIVAALGVVVIAMATVESTTALAWTLFLSRGFGQSALSVASIALLGSAFGKPVKSAAAAYSVLVGLMFGLAFKGVGSAVLHYGWRNAWTGVGVVLIAVVAPLAFLTFSTRSPSASKTTTRGGATLKAALSSPAFWTFAVGTALFGLVSSGLGLFHESILGERGFPPNVYHNVQSQAALIGVVSQLVCGALLPRISYRMLLGSALTLYAAAIARLPFVGSLAELQAYVIAMGSAGGALTLVFFGVWRQYFGERHLGRIIGAAQAGTVLASAVGPLVFAACRDRYRSYQPALWIVAAASLVVAVWAFALRTYDSYIESKPKEDRHHA